MAGQWTQPELLTKVNGSRRGYGRQDYLRFDHIASSHMPAGRGKIGQIQIDCRFIFTKSLWGYLGMNLGNTNTPAGIVYLDLDFHQPSD
ncbi:hypothetical protein B0T19DRAFT_411381 [Cercophora scortea]|uniref:Uncharacterized protein n=1 Tax=Cercophora scortea TaxID=314031 RepID=A0AAE0J515_9PEZI|nr:hypothetical protein B0T19DRAFT_411381 [Cercophora scortea]